LEAGKREPSAAALAYLADRLGVEVDELWDGIPPTWAVNLTRELACGSTEAREILERQLTTLEREGNVSTRVLVFTHRTLAEMASDPAESERHLREAVRLHEKRERPPVEEGRLLVMLGDTLREKDITTAAKLLLDMWA
jgi:hypothetical protein